MHRVEITHGDSEAHSLTCKSPQCRTGNAWGYLLKADKNSALLLNREKPLNMVGSTQGAELGLLYAMLVLGKSVIMAVELGLTQDTFLAALLTGHAVVVIGILHLS